MKKQIIKIIKIYIMNIEEPGDYYFKPEGVLFIDEKGNHTLYSGDSRHNFLRSLVQKFHYAELEEGVTFREHSAHLVNVTDQYAERFDLRIEEIHDILRQISETNPRQYFFLDKHFKNGGLNSYFMP
jgi:cystathionine beta-lyase family protein involved in aluminum resistance